MKNINDILIEEGIQIESNPFEKEDPEEVYIYEIE